MPTILWNFVDNLCTARWRTGNDRNINCPTNPTNRNAFVLRAAPASIEGGSSVPAVIWSQPGSSENASVVGTFPGLYIRGDERFRASVGCLQEFTRCNVRMQVSYRVNNGDDIPISSVDETHDGVWHNLVNDFSLAPFAGNYVTFVLRVTSRNDREPAAAWFYVELYR